MNTLKEDLKQRGLELGIVKSPFYGVAERAPALAITDAKGDAWVLPWNHFLCSRHDPGAADAPLVLTFVAHRVMVWGTSLDAITDAISNQRLTWIQAAPGKYQKTAREDEPAIEEIKVVALREPIVTE
jgi:hypothetical protein